ncbi:hypothetical protein MNBD_GAMMA04-1395 [hydrothermal vent metagenome]|uniref:Uncharacterized protein n=1 Tax=hydrothermal vent metagenome TaxID=652676 RepID=A0A3B0WKD6_9ZZZZ
MSKRAQPTKAILILGILLILIPVGAYLFHNAQSSSTPNTIEYHTPKDVEFFTSKTVGFFTPSQLEDSQHLSNYSILNTNPKENYSQFESTTLFKALNQVKNTPHKIVINLSDILFIHKTTQELNNTIQYKQQTHTKKFPPPHYPKVHKPLDPQALQNTINTLFQYITPYKSTIQALLVADEPYLNGISKQDLETVIHALKQHQIQNGLSPIPLWINFAGALFNPQFAKIVDQNLGQYVYNLDNYYQNQTQREPKMSAKEKQDFNNWKNIIKKYRLVSYEQAGNIYVQGGLPKGLDLVSFDFYLSTLLFDNMYQNVLEWFANSQKIPSCAPFKNTPLSDIKVQLSFLQNGPVSSKPQQDKQHLNQLFECRMDATTQLLQQQITKDYPADNAPSIIMIAESSSNAFFERNKDYQIEPNQPEVLVEQRVYNEVERYINYHQRTPHIFNSGIAYFLYPNAYDYSIKLKIKGVQDLPTVKSLIKETLQKQNDDQEPVRE